MDRGLKWGGIVTSAAYLFAVGLYVQSDWCEFSKLTPNEWGDFLAGVFSPLAFLWLVLGFFQQGKELRQNNEALRLQAAELKNSVDQQKELVAATHRQVDAEIENAKVAREQRSRSIRPYFAFNNNGGISSGNNHDLDFSFANLGSPVTRVRFRFQGAFAHLCKDVESINNGDIVRFKLQLVDGWQETACILNINYEDQDGQLGVASFSLSLMSEKSKPVISATSLPS